jgi:sigma-B regulation protein RsbU (phosphoserine phosphatase)
MRDASYPVTTHTLAVRDSILLFTDGLYEVAGGDGQQYGFDRLLELVSRHVILPGEQLLDELLVQTRRHAAAGEYTDDVCLVEIELAG